MTEPGEQPKPEFDIEKYTDTLSQVSPGHADEKGNVKPEFLDQEVRNKIAGISTRMYLWGMKKADQETLDQLAKESLEKLGTIYPERKAFIVDVIKEREMDSLIPHIGVLQKPEEKK